MPPTRVPLPIHGGGLSRTAIAAVWVLAAALPAPRPAQTGDAPRYRAAQLECARFAESSRSEIATSTPRAAGEGAAERYGLWQFRARDSADAVALDGWYDSLAIRRRTPAGS